MEILLILHLLAATVWTGGHIVLATTILPKALRNNDHEFLLDFEMRYEKVGMPALLIQIITGFALAYRHIPEIGRWFSFEDHFSTHIGLKIILLLVTLCFALSAKLIVIPKISQPKFLKIFAVHIFSVTVLSILFVLVGLSFRLNLIA